MKNLATWRSGDLAIGVLAAAIVCASVLTSLSARSPAVAQQTFASAGGTTLRVLLDQMKLGSGEVDIGEITFPPGADSGDHAHGAIEIFYVLSGELEHVVNGKSELLKPGMIGFVKPPDKVRHKVPGKEPAKALVIWAPGGEAGRITKNWKPGQ